MAERVLVVHTPHRIADILEAGGVQPFRLDRVRAGRCSILVSTHNALHGGDPSLHESAFLVGKISAIEQSPERPDHYLIRISEYAVLDPQPRVWSAAERTNPVWYLKGGLADIEIDEHSLRWQTLPPSKNKNWKSITSDIAEKVPPFAGVMEVILRHKRALASDLKLPQQNIEINIRG